MQSGAEVSVEKGTHRRRGEGPAAVQVGDPGGERDPDSCDGVSTERRRRDDRERDAGASGALSGGGRGQGGDRAAARDQPADGGTAGLPWDSWIGSWTTGPCTMGRGLGACRSWTKGVIDARLADYPKLSAARLPAGCPAPVATLPPRGSLQRVTFSMPRTVTFSMPIGSPNPILRPRKWPTLTIVRR